MAELLLTKQAAELGELLVGVVRSVVQAQEELDAHARLQQERLVATPLGEIGLPPLWFTFKDVEIEIALSTALETVQTPTLKPAARLVCRTVDPTSVSLYGYQAATGLRVRARLGPQGFATLRDEPPPPVVPPPPAPPATPPP